MWFSSLFLLPALAGVAYASPAPASAYIFTKSGVQNSATPVALSARDARLVLAHRLGVSKYHSLSGCDESTLKAINDFGAKAQKLFSTNVSDARPHQLVVVVEGATSDNTRGLLGEWGSVEPSFIIPDPPSAEHNKQLVNVFLWQGNMATVARERSLLDVVRPREEKSWKSNAKVLRYDLAKGDAVSRELLDAATQLIEAGKEGLVEVVLMLMPETSRNSKHQSDPYGVYRLPPKNAKRQEGEEELMNEWETESPEAPVSPASTSSDFKALQKPGAIPWCFLTLDECQTGTGNCSGHGKCYKKYGTDNSEDQSQCYTCACAATYYGDSDGPVNSTSWGGAACQKVDISSQFFILALFTIAMVGLVSWAVGLLFSIGEEKLPGVIGAGVSSSRAK